MSELTKLIAEFHATLAKFEVIAARMEEREKGINPTPDAQLTAAAPELLEALQMLILLEPSVYDSEAYERSLWQNARETIAKATEK